MGKVSGRTWALFAACGFAGAINSIPSQAATLYWDGDGTGATGGPPPTSGVGGAGTWDASTTTAWWNGTGYLLWTDAGGQDIADFRGAAATVNLSGTVNANEVRFNTTLYTLSSGTLNLTGNHIVNVAVTSATINSAITGSVGLRKTGGGSTLQLLGTSNTYTGGTVIDNNAGILVIAGDGSLGDAAGSVTMGTTTTLARAGTAGDVSIAAARTITLMGTTTIRTSTALPLTPTFTINALITGVGSLTTNSDAGGTLVLTAANTYQGTTAVGRSSQIRLSGGDNRLPTTTLLAVNGQSTPGFTQGCILDLNGTNQTVAGLTGGAGSLVTGRITNGLSSSTSTITVTNTVTTANPLGSSTYAGLLMDNGTGKIALVKSTGGKLTLSNAASNYSGGTDVTAGTLTAAGLGTGNVTVRTAGTLELTANTVINNSATLTLEENAKINLQFASGNEEVRQLVINGTTFEWAGTDIVFNAGNNYNGFATYFTSSGGGLAVMPEPSSALLLGIAVPGLAHRRRSRKPS